MAILRMILCIVVGALALLSARASAVLIFDTQAPQIALRLSPANATALVAQYDRTLLTGGKVSPKAAHWQNAARLGLKEEPLSSGALRVLALSMPDNKRAGQVMRLSERVSRRDLTAQLWLIEDSVAKEDIDGALVHYDRAWSTHPQVAAQFFPILTNAIDSVEIRAALVPYLKANRLWVPGFLGHAITNASSDEAVVDLFRRYGGSRAIPDHRALETTMLMTVVGRGDIKLAYAYARNMAGKNRALLDDFAFGDKTLNPDLRPFTWGLVDDQEIDVRFDPKEGLTAVVGPAGRGIAAYRVMMLPPGNWELAQSVSFPDSGAMAVARWSAYCLKANGAERIWIQDIPRRAGDAAYTSRFNVPDGCTATKFELTVQGADEQSEAIVQLRSVSLRAR